MTRSRARQNRKKRAARCEANTLARSTARAREREPTPAWPTPWRGGQLEPDRARKREPTPARPTPWRGGPLEPDGAREREPTLARPTPWRGGLLEPDRLNRPPHPNGVVYQYSTSQIQLPSTLNMSTSVPIAMPGNYQRRTSRSVAVREGCHHTSPSPT